jgi:hypothetical protein
MHPDLIKTQTRRHFFQDVFGATGFGLGAAALAGILSQPRAFAQTVAGSLGKHALDFAPKAKSVIYLQQAGGVPHIDIWDYKPTLQASDGQPTPGSLTKGERFAFIRTDRGAPKLAKSPFTFKPQGQMGIHLCNLVPHISKVVDNIAFVHSMHTTQFNHGPAQIYQMTGHQIPGRPAFGSWLSYGIGSEAKDLPAYVVLLSGASNPDGGSACWGSGWLPTVHQGVPFQKRGDPINFVSDPEGMKTETRRRSLDAIGELNQEHLAVAGDPEIETRISQFELAYKMQSSVPGLMDVDSEPQQIKDLYGYQKGTPSYANNALLARRLVERGVRFVQLCHRYWDMHGVSYNEDVYNKTPAACRQTDQATAALITDLKQRGLLDQTLIIYASEFGRTPMRQEGPYFGRDHHPKAYTVWMCGGGVKPGVRYGETDEFGYNAVVNPATPHDINATALYLLGIDHKKLTYNFMGRDFRLTDVEGNVIKELVL